MFPQLSRLIADAGLKNININVQSANATQLTLILSFALKDEPPAKLFEDTGDAATNQNADSVIALRSALSAPLVVTCSPEDMVTQVGAAIAQLSAGVVEAVQTYSATDINALLQKAAKSVGDKNKAAAATKSKSASKTTADNAAKSIAPSDTDDDSELDDSELDDGSEVDVQTASGSNPKAAPVVTSFSDFDSI